MNYKAISFEGYEEGLLGKGNIYTGLTIETSPQKVLLQKQDKDNNIATSDDIWCALSLDYVKSKMGKTVFLNENLDLTGFRNTADSGTDRSGISVEGGIGLPKLYTGQAYGSIKISGVSQSDIEKFYFDDIDIDGDKDNGGNKGLVNTLVVKNDSMGNYIVQNGVKKYFIDLNGDKKLTNSLEGYLGDFWSWVQNNKVLFAGMLGGAWYLGLFNGIGKALGLKFLIKK